MNIQDVLKNNGYVTDNVSLITTKELSKIAKPFSDLDFKLMSYKKVDIDYWLLFRNQCDFIPVLDDNDFNYKIEKHVNEFVYSLKEKFIENESWLEKLLIITITFYKGNESLTPKYVYDDLNLIEKLIEENNLLKTKLKYYDIDLDNTIELLYTELKSLIKIRNNRNFKRL